jgi:hypothetical protein
MTYANEELPVARRGNRFPRKTPVGGFWRAGRARREAELTVFFGHGGRSSFCWLF